MALTPRSGDRNAPSRSRLVTVVLHGAVLAVAAGWAVRVSFREGCVALSVAVAAQVALAYVGRPFDNRDAALLGWKLALALVAQGFAAAFTLPVEGAIVVIAGSALLLRLAIALLYHWPGGVTAWSLPLVGLVVEAFTLSYMQKGVPPLG